MNKRGRPPSKPPQLAYEYRRYITLVQVLALFDDIGGVLQLCKAWNVTPIEDRSVIPESGVWPIDTLATIRELAKHAMAYHRVKSVE